MKIWLRYRKTRQLDFDAQFDVLSHYVDYQLGPHVVPMLDASLQFYAEKKEFDRSVYGFFEERDIEPDPFAATFKQDRSAKSAKATKVVIE